MKDKKKYLISFAFSLILLILTCYFIFKDNSISDIINVLKNANIKYILISILMIVIYLITQAGYLKIIFKHLGEKVSLLKGFVYACIEFYFSGITPSSTGGQPVQMYYMKKDNIPIGKSSIAVLLVTAIFKMVLIILGILALIFKGSLILKNGALFNIIFFLGMAVNIAIIFGCLAIMFSKRLIKNISIKFIKFLSKIKLIKYPEKIVNKIENLLEEYTTAAKYIRENFGLSLKVFILTLVQRIAMFSVGYYIYKALGMQEYGYFDLMFIQVIIAIAIDSLPFPGGIGISEVMLTLIYEKIFGPDIVLPAMLLTRCISYYFCLIISGIVSLINHIRLTISTKEEQGKEIT